jgi:hypothetical protein
MPRAASVISADLPAPCADCRCLVERVTAATGPWQQDEIAGAHPHARPDDPRAADYLRCSICRCCWRLRFDLWEVAAIDAEQLSEAEYHRQVRSIRYGLPFTEGRWGAILLVYVPILLTSGGLTAAIAWFAARDVDGWAKAWPAFVLFLCIAFVFALGLVRTMRES